MDYGKFLKYAEDELTRHVLFEKTQYKTVLIDGDETIVWFSSKSKYYLIHSGIHKGQFVPKENFEKVVQFFINDTRRHTY
jgi:hypothetical protein